MKSKRWILLILTGLILGVFVYQWNAETLTGNKMPMPFGYGVSVVLSGSMEPALQVNDLVIIRRTDTVEAGDIVVYQSEGLLVIHRVISVTDEAVVTQGDANNVPDAPISSEAIKGVLVCSVPKIGALVWLLKKPAVVVCILVLLCVLNERAFRKERHRKNEELEKLRSEVQSLSEEIKNHKGGERK